MLDNAALKDLVAKMVTPAVKREAVAHVRSAFELSERRAWRMVGCVRMTSALRSLMAVKDNGSKSRSAAVSCRTEVCYPF
jgi:putative transposase